MDSFRFRLRSLMELALAAMSHQEINPDRDRNVISRSNGMLRGSPALLRVFLALSVATFAVSAKSAAPPQQFNLGERGQSGAVIRTEREVYLAGETVNVSGSGFSPYERVGLRVTHANGITEANMGHEMWWINADFDGTFQATWRMSSVDSGGTEFVIEAAGSSGSSARAAFVRSAAMSTDRSSFRSGEKAWITGRGFNPGERVNITVQDGGNRAPLIQSADENGQVRAEVELPEDKLAASFLTMQAIAPDSGVTASMTIPYSFFAVLDQQGANDVPAQSDLTQMGRDNSDPNYYQLFWSWDSIDQWTGTGQTGDACALFDNDGDGKINFVVCGQVTNQNANPNVVVQTTGSPFAFACNNARTDRCGNPSPRSHTSMDIQAGPFPGSTATPAGNVLTDTDPFGPTASNGPGSSYPYDSTLYMKIRKAFLPSNSQLVNVCSYPSAGNGGNNNPFDCIVSPGGGFLEIKKVANASTTSTTNFNFVVNPIPSGEPSNYTIPGSGQTPAIGVAIGNGSETVTETVPPNWALTAASCTLEGGAGTGSFDNANHRVTGITIESGKITTCTFTNNEASLTLAKSASPTTYNAVGQVITYTYTITNSGYTTLAGPFSVSDDKQGTFNCGSGPLAAGASTSCTSKHTITQADIDAGSITNIATVSGNGLTSKPVSATVTASQTKALALVKSANPTAYSNVGQIITYTYKITNSGNTTLSGPFSVTDDKQGTFNCGSGPLAPGAFTSCTSTHTITQADINAGSITNKATASGNGVSSPEVSVTVTANQIKALTLAKGASTTTYSTVGQVITYTYTITNGGNTTLSGPFSLSDDKLGTISPCGSGPLAPGASTSCTSSHTITQADIDAGSITNKATASGNGASSPEVSATVTANQTKALTLAKSASPTAYNAVGQVITYTYAITNSGNTTLTGPFSLADDKQGTINPCGSGPLAPGASTSCTTTHTITQTDIDGGSITNIATVSFGGVTSNSARATVIANQTMSIDLSDAATPRFSSPPVAGDTITYSFKITNTGNVTLSGVVLTDATLPGYATGGICGGMTTFIPGASTTCSGIYTLTPGDINAGHVSTTNVSQACGNPPSGATVCDTLNVRVEQ